MAQFDMRSPAAFPTTGEIPAVRVTAFLRKVYGWMFVGLAVTAVVASTVAGSPTLIQHVFSNQILYFGLILAQLGLVFYLSARVQTLAPNMKHRWRRSRRKTISSDCQPIKISSSD